MNTSTPIGKRKIVPEYPFRVLVNGKLVDSYETEGGAKKAVDTLRSQKKSAVYRRVDS